MSWWKNFLKGIAKKYLKKNKKEINYLFDDLTDEVFASAKVEFYKKFPNLPADVKTMVEAFITCADDEMDKYFAEELEKLIDKLGEIPVVEGKIPEGKEE